MIYKPIFKPHYNVETITGEGVLLLTEDSSKALHGRFYELIVPLIDGKLTSDEIVDELDGKISAAEAYYTLSILEENGHITEGGNTVPDKEAAYWWGQDIDPSEMSKKLKGSTVSITVYGDVETDNLKAALKRLGIREGKKQGLDIVITDNYLCRELLNHNSNSLKHGRPWILAKPVGYEVWIGPLFVPGETGCYNCLRHRLATNRIVEQFVSRKNHGERSVNTSRAVIHNTLDVAFNMLSCEVAKLIAKGENKALEGKVLSLETRNWKSATHTLTRRPQCPDCGSPRKYSKRKPEPVRLENRKVLFTEDGGHRTTTPEETLRRYEHHVSHITGVVTSLVPMPDSKENIYVYYAGHNHAMKFDSMDFLKQGLRNGSSGKGMSDVQAKASGLCEALERDSGNYDGSEHKIMASYKELGRKAIHPYKCMLYSRKQYSKYKEWNKKGSKFNTVMEPFDEKAKIYWSPVWSLTHEKFKYLPTQLIYFGAPASKNSRRRYCQGCSNGNASGNNLEEAILQGFFELVERDCVALWWYNMLNKRGVDMESFGVPYLMELREYMKSINREIWALDITSDLGIPAFAAISRRVDQEEERILFGIGCHLDAKIALTRAVTEMNQMNQMLGLDHTTEKSDDDKVQIEDNETIQWLKNATIENQPYIAPVRKRKPVCFTDFPQRYSGDLLKDILYCKDIIGKDGMEMLVLDQTRPDIGVSVAKVIVPGLRHFWARYAPGRLYDVPVKMGWMKKPLKEKDLNPLTMFL